MTTQEITLMSVQEAKKRHLVPLTMAEYVDIPILAGHRRESMRYIDWLTLEQQRITRGGNRQAVIVDEKNEKVALWVDDVASRD